MEEKLDILHELINEYQKGVSFRRYSYLNTKKYCYERILKNFNGEKVLELGSDGTATSSILVRWSKSLTIVDLEDKFTQQLKKDEDLKNAKFIQSLWEDFKPEEKFTDIFLTDSLEHVENPIALLQIIKEWLSEEGRLHIIVPNALSVHRLLGVEMGFIKTPYELTEHDLESGHVKVYDMKVLENELNKAGFNNYKLEGIQFKPMTDNQLRQFDDSFSRGLDNLSKYFPENCAEIYACCYKK